MMLRPVSPLPMRRGDRERCAVLTNRSIRDRLVFAALVVTVFACLSRGIMVGFLGPKYEPSAAGSPLLLPLIVMRCVRRRRAPGLIAANRAGIYARLTFAGAVVNFALNIVLIPKLASTGAIIATLISYIPIEVIGLVTLRRAFPRFWHRADTIVALKTLPTAALIIALYRVFATEPSSLPLTILHALAICAVFCAAALLLAS